MLEKISGYYLGLMYVVYGLIGVFIHFWAINIVYMNYGWFKAVLAFFFPIISEIALILLFWTGTGNFFNLFSQVIVIYLITYWIFIVVLAGIFKSLSKNAS